MNITYTFVILLRQMKTPNIYSVFLYYRMVQKFADKRQPHTVVSVKVL